MKRCLLPVLLLCACDAGHLSISDTAGADGDGDGYREAFDCDDGDAAVHPEADEVCDGVDNDCDGVVDGDPSDGGTWYEDGDGDGWGLSSSTVVTCEMPSGYTTVGEDCDDEDAAVHPDAEDACDGLDNDCDGDADEDALDSDGDGTPNCLDATVYSYDFDDGLWTDWSWVDLGGGNSPDWMMDGGALGEMSNSALSVAYGPDLGELSSYTVSVEGTSSGEMNDEVGLVFSYQGAGSYLVLRWLDPNGYYGSYPKGGNVDLAECSWGVCTSLAADDGGVPLLAQYNEFVRLSVTVSDGQAQASWGDQVVLEVELPAAAAGGPQVIGVTTDDNDAGVLYDNIAVTIP